MFTPASAKLLRTATKTLSRSVAQQRGFSAAAFADSVKGLKGEHFICIDQLK